MHGGESAARALAECCSRADGRRGEATFKSRAAPELAGARILIVDDDIRNIFSLASALEEYGVDVRYAESGRAGLDILDSLPMWTSRWSTS